MWDYMKKFRDVKVKADRIALSPKMNQVSTFYN